MKHSPIHAAPQARSTDLTPLQTAQAILFNGAASTLGATLTASEEKEWIDAAQYVIDTGDLSELEYMLKCLDAAEAYEEYAYDTHFRAEPLEFGEWMERSAESYLPGRVAL